MSVLKFFPLSPVSSVFHSVSPFVSKLANYVDAVVVKVVEVEVEMKVVVVVVFSSRQGFCVEQSWLSWITQETEIARPL